MDPKDYYLSKPWLTNYPDGVPPEVDTPKISVQQRFDQMADKYSHKIALIFYGKKISYQELKEPRIALPPPWPISVLKKAIRWRCIYLIVPSM